MPNNNFQQKLRLSNLIDTKFLQKLQDKFAKLMNIACVMLDTQGAITKPSNFSEFCLKHAKNEPVGLSICDGCDIAWESFLAKKTKPEIFKCPMGLTVFTIPIIVKEKNIALIFGGQTFSKKPNEVFFKNIAKKEGIEEEEYLKTVKKIRITPNASIKSSVELLFFVANSISEIAHKNYELIDKNLRAEVTKKIITKLRSTLDSEEIKKYFIKITADYFKPDRCLFVDFDKSTGKFLPFRLENLKSPDIKSLVGIDLEVEFPEFCTKLKKGKTVIIKDLEKTLKRKDFLTYKSIQTLEKSEVKSDYGLLVQSQNEIFGILIMHFIKEKKVLSHDEFEFLHTIKEQTGTGLFQARIYTKIKLQAQREILLRKVTAAIRSSLDINKVKKIIVDIVGKTLKADRCFITDYDKEHDNFLTVQDEYLSSLNVKAYSGFDSNIEIPYFIKTFKDGKTIIVRNKKVFINNEAMDFNIEREATEKFNVNSSFSKPLFHQNELLGVLSLHYTREYSLNEDEINLMKIISNQVAIAIYQARLFKSVNEKSQREILLRNLIEAIRTSLNLNETKRKIVDNIGKTLNADRCFIMEYDEKLDKFLIIDEEYLSSNDIKSYKGVDLNEHIPQLAEAFKQGKRLIINADRFLLDEDKYDVNDIKFEQERHAIEDYKVYSAFGFPIYYKNCFCGDLILHYVDRHHDVGDDEIIFLNLIANQIGIAIHQAKLYERIQLQSERERISRNIIEIMRSTLDKNIIKHLFVKNIGKYFNADRVYFSEYSSKLNKYLPITEKSEYLSSPKEKSFITCDPSSPTMINFTEALLENRERIIPNWKIYIEQHPQNPEFRAFFEESKIKSSYSFPVLYESQRMGYFCIGYSSKIVELTEEDINRIRSICSQAGIALYHADLYMKTQEALHAKGKIIAKVKIKIKDPVDNILKNSQILSEIKLERKKQIECLDNIIKSCNELLELTKNILDT
jgi:GAF domain-containing protein/ligand-binding sensor protein